MDNVDYACGVPKDAGRQHVWTPIRHGDALTVCQSNRRTARSHCRFSLLARAIISAPQPLAAGRKVSSRR